MQYICLHVRHLNESNTDMQYETVSVYGLLFVSFKIESVIIDPDKGILKEQKNLILFLPLNLNMCFECSKTPSH